MRLASEVRPVALPILPSQIEGSTSSLVLKRLATPSTVIRAKRGTHRWLSACLSLRKANVECRFHNSLFKLQNYCNSLKMSSMQASQITTGLRQFRTICTPLSVFVCRGYELGYELCLLGAKRCTLRQTQGNKKVPQIIEFVGLVCSLSRFCPQKPAGRQGFEPRVPRSTTVFKTAAIDHSATSPKLLFQKYFSFKAVQRYKSFFILQTFLHKNRAIIPKFLFIPTTERT